MNSGLTDLDLEVPDFKQQDMEPQKR